MQRGGLGGGQGLGAVHRLQGDREAVAPAVQASGRLCAPPPSLMPAPRSLSPSCRTAALRAAAVWRMRDYTAVAGLLRPVGAPSGVYPIDSVLRRPPAGQAKKPEQANVCLSVHLPRPR